MILQRFFHDGLAQASYLVGCGATGEAVVVDPNRDAAAYVAAARSQNLRITHVTETHIHADYLSGLRELCAATGAQAYLSNEGGADWQYASAAADKAVLLSDGDTFMVGNIRFEAVHTPGHTPEHLTFLVTDTAGADRPVGAFTGDFIFAGDVGRPDLLEKAAGVAGTMEAGAGQLYASIQRFKTQPDYLQLWPGHGAGSACGKSLGAMPQTTLGYERLFNWALADMTESAFIRAVLDGQSDPPTYFAQMKRLNRAGPHVLNGMPAPAMMPSHELEAVLDSGALVVDTRPWPDYAAAHVRGTISIPLNRSFVSWAGWLLPYDADVYLVTKDAMAAQAAVRELALIGIDRVAGVFTADAVSNARADRIGTIDQTDVRGMSAAAAERGNTILDVRNAQEWQAGHVPVNGGAMVLHIPLGQLQRRIAEVPRGERVLVHCKGGTRSAIAASILERNGIDAENVKGGFDAWLAAGLGTD
ncbi:MAG TPA: MBL fold metallo-hydrolase [Longimicrobiales bacterium]